MKILALFLLITATAVGQTTAAPQPPKTPDWVLPHCAPSLPDPHSDTVIASCLLTCPAGYSLDSINYRCYVPKPPIDCKKVPAGDDFAAEICKMFDGATWQLLIPPADAKLNPTLKPCGPDNHQNACIDTKARWLSYHIYGDQKNCENDEGVSCVSLAEYWIPIGKVVVYDNTPAAGDRR